MLKFDDAETYFLNFTTDLPNEAGGIPIGLYLLWAASAELLSPDLQREVTRRHTQGKGAADILFDVTDGKLMAADFNGEGAAFTADYYSRDYLTDYERSFALSEATVDAFCSVPDTTASLERLKPALDIQLSNWRARRREEAPAPTPALKPSTVSEVFAQLKRELLPQLHADGFQEVRPWETQFEVRRRVGVIEQQLLIMVSESSSGVSVSIFIFLGAERLRHVWLRLSGRQDDPPPAFTAAVRQRPEVQANDLSLTEVDNGGYAAFYSRVPAGPERPGRITLMHYLEVVRPRLNALVSIAELARQVQFSGQRRRLSSQRGFMKGPELLARIVLLAVYTEEFQGRDAASLVKQLHDQVRFNIDRATDGFPDDADIDQLIAALSGQDTREQVRNYLDRPT